MPALLLQATASGTPSLADPSSPAPGPSGGQDERAPASDPLLTEDVDAALAGLADPAGAASGAAALDRPGSRIGPYHLLQKLGEGGMGAVYLAEQERPVRRRVALKVIKAGFDSA